jgi:hypothetical protein
MTLTMNEEEQEVLGRLLAGRLHDLRIEVRHTDSREFKIQLRHEEAILERLVERLAGRPAA